MADLDARALFQFEDKLRSDWGRILLGKQPLYRDLWRKHVLAGDGPRSVGSSVNWWENSAGLCAWDRFDPGAVRVTSVLAVPNDHLLQEGMVDPRHGCFNLEGLYGQRKSYRRDGKMDLARKVDATILQFWAMIAMTADQLDGPARSVFAYAHQRTVFPMGAADIMEYYFRRGYGVAHAATGLAQKADRSGANQEPFTPHLWADSYLSDLKLDVGRIVAAYKLGGKGSIARFIRNGTRATYHWVVLDNGGYIHIQENDVGVDEQRSVEMRSSKGSSLIQHPSGVVARNARDCWAKIDMQNGKVDAHDSVYGDLHATFDPKAVAVYVTSSPAGVVQQINTSPELRDDSGGGESAGVPGGSPTGGPSGNPAAPGSASSPPPSSHIHKSAGIYGWQFGGKITWV